MNKQQKSAVNMAKFIQSQTLLLLEKHLERVMPLSEAKKQKQREAKSLLEGFWGQAFKFNQPKPLKVGILEDMVEDAKARNLPFDLEIIRAALSSMFTAIFIKKRSEKALSVSG